MAHLWALADSLRSSEAHLWSRCEAAVVSAGVVCIRSVDDVVLGTEPNQDICEKCIAAALQEV